MERWEDLRGEGRGSMARAMGDLYRKFQIAAAARDAKLGGKD